MFSISRWAIPERGRKYALLFQEAEYSNNLPRFLLARMAQQESNFDPKAISKANAQGIMQIVPKWHPGVDPWNPGEAIPYAGSYMRQLFNQFEDWRKALSAYNAGPGATQQRIDQYGVNWLAHMPMETQNYVARISADVLA